MPIVDAPPELQEAVKRRPQLWIRNFLRHPERPTDRYDFWDADKEQYLHYLTDESAGPLNPDNWGDINVLLFCRGGLKTFTATAVASWAVDVYPTVEFDATAPVDDQRYEVVDRFKEKVEQSGLDERRAKNKLSHQKFEHSLVDETGESFTSYSHLKSRSAWGDGDKLRGLHGHGGIIDEAQDVDEGTFTTFATEAIDRSVPNVDFFPSVFVIGTPKMANSFFHKLWDMSDKKTWDSEAEPPADADREDGAWVSEDEPEYFLPENLKEDKRKLQERIDELKAADADYTDEIAQLHTEISEINDKGFTVRGWHIDQYNSPIHDDASVAFKKQTYPKKKFKNEVMAEFYSPENDLITNDDVWANLEDTKFRTERQYRSSTTALAVDWGGGDSEGAASTVVTVGEYIPADVSGADDDVADGHIDILNFEILDSSLTSKQEREYIDEWMQQYDVDVAVVDEGFNGSSRQVLQDEFGYDDLYGCGFGHVSKKEEIVWNRFNNEKRFFTANKTFMVQKFAEDFRDGKLSIPKDTMSFTAKRDTGTKLVDQLTAPYTDRDETSSGKKKLKVVSDRNDDIFDSFLYLWIAIHRLGGTREAREIFTDMRSGY